MDQPGPSRKACRASSQVWEMTATGERPTWHIATECQEEDTKGALSSLQRWNKMKSWDAALRGINALCCLCCFFQCPHSPSPELCCWLFQTVRYFLTKARPFPLQAFLVRRSRQNLLCWDGLVEELWRHRGGTIPFSPEVGPKGNQEVVKHALNARKLARKKIMKHVVILSEAWVVDFFEDSKNPSAENHMIFRGLHKTKKKRWISNDLGSTEGFQRVYFFNPSLEVFFAFFLAPAVLAQEFLSVLIWRVFKEFQGVQQEVCFGRGKSWENPSWFRVSEDPKMHRTLQGGGMVVFWVGWILFHTELVGRQPLFIPTQLTSMHSCSLPHIYV